MKWAVSLVILHMITSIFVWALCGYINLKGEHLGAEKWPGPDNQYKLVFTFYIIGYLGVSGTQWLR